MASRRSQFGASDCDCRSARAGSHGWDVHIPPIERIAAPTLVISVADDLFGTYDTARYTAEHIPGARFVGYKTGGHVWVGHHEQLMSEIGAFLKSR